MACNCAIGAVYAAIGAFANSPPIWRVAWGARIRASARSSVPTEAGTRCSAQNGWKTGRGEVSGPAEAGWATSVAAAGWLWPKPAACAPAVDMQTESAALHLDFGAPLGNATVRGAVYSREYERATVALDCSRWEGSFVPRPS